MNRYITKWARGHFNPDVFFVFFCDMRVSRSHLLIPRRIYLHWTENGSIKIDFIIKVGLKYAILIENFMLI